MGDLFGFGIGSSRESSTPGDETALRYALDQMLLGNTRQATDQQTQSIFRSGQEAEMGKILNLGGQAGMRNSSGTGLLQNAMNTSLASASQKAYQDRLMYMGDLANALLSGTASGQGGSDSINASFAGFNANAKSANQSTTPGDPAALRQVIAQLQQDASQPAMDARMLGIYNLGTGGNTQQRFQNDLTSRLSGASQQALQAQELGIGKLGSQLLQGTRSTASSSSSVGGGWGCYITTAICTAWNLPDDCKELRILRRWRDEVLAKTEEGRALIQLYYATAPQLAAAATTSFLKKLRRTYIWPAIKAIEAGKDIEAFLIYTEMLTEVLKENKHG